MHPVALPTSATSPQPALKRKIAAILAADVAGYSRMVAEDEEGTLHALAAAREVFDAAVQGAGGRIFNTAGDSIMCEFDSAVEAVRVAVAVQETLAAGSLGLPSGRRLLFRIGITIGDVVERGGDLLGDGVNIAARLESLAPPGGICVSRSVHESVANKVAAEFRDIGSRQVKNIPQPVHAFLIPPPADGAAALPPGRLRQGKGPARTLMAVALVSAGLGGAGYWLTREQAETRVASPPPAARSAATPAAPAARPATEPGRQASEAGRPANEAATPRPATPTPPRAVPEVRSATRPEPAPSPAPAPSFNESYAAARAAEAKGDAAGALKLYAALAPAAGDRLDPLLRYAALLRSADGAPSPARVLGDLAKQPGARAAALVAASVAPAEERLAAIEAFAAAQRDYAPTPFFLAEALLASHGGSPTLTERRLAFDSYDDLIDAEDGNRLAPFFVEDGARRMLVESARRRREEIATAFAAAATRPRANFARSETGWIATLTLPEPATAIAARIGDRGDFMSTGTIAAIDPRTGRPTPVPRVSLPGSAERTTLYVTYTDRTGREAGPFAIPFDPGAALVASARDALERFPDSWITFRPDLPNVASYALIVANRCAVTQALIGWGTEAPSHPIELPPCDPQRPAAIAANARAVLTLPDGVDAVQVKLAYADGTESPVRTYRR